MEVQMGTIRVMIPQLMAEHDMNITRFAELMNISRPTAGKLAKGKLPWIRVDQLIRICELFNVRVEDILIYQPDGTGR
jgi:DNA-binding Xre family transcriptional regulator